MNASSKNRKEKETSGNTIDLTMFIPNGNTNNDGIERERRRRREKKSWTKK
jgi:hypothetical protein